MFFGSSGDLGYLQRLIAQERFRTKVLARKTLAEDGWQVEYITTVPRLEWCETVVMKPMMGVDAPWA